MAETTRRMASATMARERRGGSQAGFLAAGIVLGIGLGSFVDGIVLHQMLQWHHMVSAVEGYPVTTVPGLEHNTLWDGIFHSAAWVATATGLALLWIAAPFPRAGWGLPLLGLMLAGWGLFNVVEGVVDHHILGIHHVRDDIGAPIAWDLAFLAFGVAQIVVGLAIARPAWRGARQTVAG